MRDAVERMYASGELDRILRYCGVREDDLPDLRQEVAEILLTTKSKVSNLGAFTVSVVQRQYRSKKSRWWRRYGRWAATRNGLQDADGEVYSDDGLGHLGGGYAPAEDLQGTRTPHAQRTDDIFAGGGTWYNSGSGKAIEMPPQHRQQDLPQDRKTTAQ